MNDWYCDERGHIFVPSSGVPYLEARRIARDQAPLLSGDNGFVLRYENKRDIELTDHETGCRCKNDGCNLRTEPCWVFMVGER